MHDPDDGDHPDGAAEETSLSNLNDSLANLSSGLLKKTKANTHDARTDLPLYGALKAVQSVLGPVDVCEGGDGHRSFGDVPDSLLSHTASIASLDSLGFGDIQAFRDEEQVDLPGFRPQETWRNMPRGGEAAFDKPVGKAPLRLQVAHMQEMLSEAQNAMTKCLEVVSKSKNSQPEEGRTGMEIGIDDPTMDARAKGLDKDEEEDLSFEELWVSTRSYVHKAKEVTTMEEEAKTLREKELAMIKKIADIEQEARELQAQATANSEAAAQKRSRSGKVPHKATLAGCVRGMNKGKEKGPALVKNLDAAMAMNKANKEDDPNVADTKAEAQLHSALQLLGCLKEVALINRSFILPENTKWTREQQAVACFLDSSADETSATFLLT